MTNDKTIDQLNSFLRGEISAVEAYRIAREKVSALGPLVELDQCLRSHEERVSKLTSRIITLGGEPASKSGAWGTLAKLVEGGAAVLGEGPAIAALEEGEDHGLRDYKSGLDKVDLETRAFVLKELLEQQERTHRLMSDLKKLGKRGETRTSP